jgi:hypothetical protein
MVQARYGSLGILGHSLRNKIPFIGNQGESKVGSMEGWKKEPPLTTVPRASEGKGKGG